MSLALSAKAFRCYCPLSLLWNSFSCNCRSSKPLSTFNPYVQTRRCLQRALDLILARTCLWYACNTFVLADWLMFTTSTTGAINTINVRSKTRLCQSEHIYMKNIPAKFHHDPIWNNGALGVFKDVRPNNNNKMSSDMRSVPDLKRR